MRGGSSRSPRPGAQLLSTTRLHGCHIVRRGTQIAAAELLAGRFPRVWDPKGSTWKDEPAKDWSTHAADALRMGAQGTRGGVPLVAQPIVVETRFDLGDFASGRRDSERTLL